MELGSNDSGVYSLEEAKNLGIFGVGKLSEDTLRFIPDYKRKDLLNLIEGIEHLHVVQLRNLREIYQSRLDITEESEVAYLNMVNDVREHWIRDIDEIERLFKDALENVVTIVRS